MGRVRASLRRRLSKLRRLTTSTDARRQWQRERFLAHARRYTPIIAVDDRNGHRYFVSTSDPALARGLFLNRAFETENLDSLLEVFGAEGYRPQQIIDVGANIGTTSINLLARMPGANGIAFEPHSDNFRLLRQNLLANDMTDRVKTFNAAVSDRDGTVQLELSPQHPGDHRVRVTEAPGRFAEDTWEVTMVPARKLDSVVDQGHIDPDTPSLLWIDAQGHEAQILSGAKRLWHVPTVVELWPYGLRRAAGLDLFIDLVATYEKVIELGDRPRTLTRTDFLARVEEVDAARQYTDLLLMPPHRPA